MSDAQRTARLAGAERPLPVRRVPPPLVRAAERAAMKAGVLSYERALLPRAARAVPKGEPRLLIRVDEFPYYSSYDEYERYGLAASVRFHETMAGMPHLMSIVPQLTHAALDPGAEGGRPLNDDERAHLRRMAGENVTFAQHGTTHRTRDADPRRRSELAGLAPRDAATLIDRGLTTLRDLGVEPRVFVPPYNRFDPEHYPVLADRFDVIGGGPETVARLGFHFGPQWRDGAVYLPCYPPFYGRAGDIVAPVERLVEQRIGTWVPVVLHLSWEVDDDFKGLERFVEAARPYAASWDDFLGAVEASA